MRLSFCIATLDRAAFIGETIASIVEQATPDVEIVVLDGGSKDATPQVIEQWRVRFANLKYVRLDAPGGVDRDFDRAVDAATGEFCWLMSDDDLLRPGAVRAVLEQLQPGTDLVIANAEVKDLRMREVLRDRLLQLPADRTYGPADTARLFVDVADYLSFIGAVIIRRSLWLARERARYFGTAFIHVGVIFQSPIPGRAVVLAQALVSIRYGNEQWTSRSFEIWMFRWPKLIWSFAGVSDADKARVVPREPWRSWRRLLFFRAKGAFADQQLRSWDGSSAPAPGFAARVVARIPGVPLNLLMSTFVKLTGRDRMSQVDMQNSRFHWRRRQP